MIKKIKMYLKFAVCCTLIISLFAPSYAALSSSDGSAFVTKAEFDSALSDFNARLTTFEAGINSKIDSQVTSYLDRNGIWSGKKQKLENGFDDAYVYSWQITSNKNIDYRTFTHVIFYPSEVSDLAGAWAQQATHNRAMPAYGHDGQNRYEDNRGSDVYGAYQYYFYALTQADSALYHVLKTEKTPRVKVVDKIDKSGLFVTTVQYVWECFSNNNDQNNENVSGIANWKAKERAERDKINISQLDYKSSDSCFWDIFVTAKNNGQVSTVSYLNESYNVYISDEQNPDVNDDSKFELMYAQTVGTAEMGFTQRTKKSTGLHPRGIAQLMIFVKKGQSIWFDAHLKPIGRNCAGLCMEAGTDAAHTPNKATAQLAYRFQNASVY